MVSIQHTQPFLDNVDLTHPQAWLDAVSRVYETSEMSQIRLAYQLAEPLYLDQAEITGKPLLQHAIGAASILISINMDAASIIATLLHATPQYLPQWQEKIEQQFGREIYQLVEGISRIEAIQQFNEIQNLQAQNNKPAQSQQIEGLRKMLLAMVSDIRVVLIKLAERAQTLRNLSDCPATLQHRIAYESQTIFAPLANRLGIWQIKWELEDLSIRYLEPVLYRQVAKLLDERRVDRELYIQQVLEQLKQALTQQNISADVAGRPKHIYSIINKMKHKKLDFSQLYDVRAVRVLVNDIEDCYNTLSVVHELWHPIPSEYDDYIAQPKGNNYRSLHTVVVGPKGHALEVQIRTHQMHYDSELGVAAHWRYKEKSQSDASYDEKIAWLRQILAWRDDLSQQGALKEQFQNQLFSDQIYVLTPQGKVIALPRGATPLDFAYTLHSGIGHRTRGAKVDGKMVPLNYPLQNAQRVEILTGKHENPSRDWGNPNLGFLFESRHRSKVRSWFNTQNHSEHIAQGKQLLERELQKIGAHNVNLDKLAQQLHFNKSELLLAAVARGDVAHKKLLLAIQAQTPVKLNLALPPLPPSNESKTSPKTHKSGRIVVGGEANMPTRLAKCCNPQLGDAIMAYITRDHQLSIHRQDCHLLQNIPEHRQTRCLSAYWEDK